MKNKRRSLFLLLLIVFTFFGCQTASRNSLLSDPEGKTWVIIKEDNIDYSNDLQLNGYILYDHGTAFYILYSAKTMKEKLLFSGCDDCGDTPSIRDAYCFWEVKDDTLFMKRGNNSPYNLFKEKIDFLSEDSLVVSGYNHTYILKPKY